MTPGLDRGPAVSPEIRAIVKTGGEVGPSWAVKPAHPMGRSSTLP